MKIKHLLIIFLILILSSFILIKEINKEHKMYEESAKNNEHINNILSIMLEENPKSGKYILSENEKWPDDNYVYNENLSYCENNSKLVWNDEIRSITLNSDLTDKCYLYFDIYVLPTINSLDIKSTDTSINVIPNITKGDYDVSKIFYKLDDQDEIETLDNNYTFNNISNITKHTISVYVADINNKKSKTYTYELSYFKNITLKSTLSTIDISLQEESGTGKILKYYYSIDNGATYIEEKNNTYTFGSLTEDTKYNIKIYVLDENNIKSMYYVTNISTKAKPTSPSINFDSSYNIVLSGGTSKNGSIEYYYSTDNKNFTKGSTVSLTNSATIYAYVIDSEGYKSNTVSKNVTITNSTNGTVSNVYYCNKTNFYQTSSTCSYSYSASKDVDYVCSSGSYNSSEGYCTGTYGISRSWTWRECEQTCSSDVHGGYAYTCEYNDRTDGYYCSFNYGSPTINTTYSCPNGGTLSGSTCTGVTYTGTLKYKCNANNTYHDSQASATTSCANYCETGTYFNNKCYNLN